MFRNIRKKKKNITWKTFSSRFISVGVVGEKVEPSRDISADSKWEEG